MGCVSDSDDDVGSDVGAWRGMVSSVAKPLVGEESDTDT